MLKIYSEIPAFMKKIKLLSCITVIKSIQPIADNLDFDMPDMLNVIIWDQITTLGVK